MRLLKKKRKKGREGMRKGERRIGGKKKTHFGYRNVS